MKTSIQKIVPRAIGGTLHAVNTIAPELVGRTCIRLFCTPREGRLDADDEAFLSGAAQRGQLLHPTGPIPYYVWNPAATQSILLLHGWESNAARWQRLLPYLLEADLRVIAIDAPAHGASEQRLFDMKRYADFLHSTMLHFKPDFLLGHSVGGATAVYYSTHYPTPAFKKLVLLGAPSRLEYMMGMMSKVLGLSPNVRASMNQYFEKKFGLPVHYFSGEQFCESIQIPTLLIHDLQDQVVDVQESIRSHSALPQGELLLTEGLGHSLQSPEVFERVISFLKV